MADKTILVVGTYDTKDEELTYIADCIAGSGGGVITMDVSVLGDPTRSRDISKHDVTAAANSSIEAAIACDDENAAMQIMAAGSAALTGQLHEQGTIDGVIVLGGTMGTDLALDVCQALPLGVPKYVVSTVSFSSIIPADRLSPDIQMILWAGGLYGLNSVCKSSLSQAAGAVLGAARAAIDLDDRRPMIGMTSLGSSCLSYMKLLREPLQERGYEVAIFHATGMGGMAFERIAAQGGFVCVMDFGLSEMANLLAGSVVNAGQDRMLNAGRAGIPQMVAPGCIDLVDFAGWQDIPERFEGRPFHEHNRLIKSSSLNEEERRESAREVVGRMAQSTAPAHFFMPLGGVEEWDRPGDMAHDPVGLAAFADEIRKSIKAPVGLTEIDAHINDQAFADAVLALFDEWVAAGIVASAR